MLTFPSTYRSYRVVEVDNVIVERVRDEDKVAATWRAPSVQQCFLTSPFSTGDC
jgi:hypothetical protein